jgi:hypothetical protein
MDRLEDSHVNIDNDTAVKMETYLDKQNTNNWTKVTDLIDNGGWYTTSTDKEFYSAGCNKPKDYIVTNPGSIVTFRSDNIVWDFKNLSVREIKSCLRASNEHLNIINNSFYHPFLM